MNSKTQRLNVIRSLIRSKSVSTQAELMALLQEEGFEVAQATLSRDLKELGVTKVHDGTSYRFQVSPVKVQDRSSRIESANGVLGFEVSVNIGVLKTRPGYAAMIASRIDDSAPEGLLGSVAGDDTILLVFSSPVSGAEARQMLSPVLPELGREGI